MSDSQLGSVDHFYSRIQVAAVKLNKGNLKLGETIKVKDRQGNEVFEQEISSMQINGEDIEEASKGQDIGIKMDQKVKEGYGIYKS